MFQLCLFFFLFQSCSNFKSSDQLRIITHSTNKTSEKAMKSAYKKALQAINELGCDKEKGVGNVTYKHVKKEYIAEAIYYVSPKDCRKDNKCSDEEWASGPIKTQVGSLILFSGTGVSAKRSEAHKISKNEALMHLAAECKPPSRSVQFLERCEEFTSNAFVVMTRATIKQEDCKH